MKDLVARTGALCIIWLTIMTLWMGLYPFRTIYVKEPAEVLNPVVDSGDILKYEIDYCKYTEAPAVFTRSLISISANSATPPLTYTTNSFSSGIPKGCGKYIEAIEIPSYIQGGDYYVNISVRHRVNFLQERVENFRTQNFYVFNPLPKTAEDIKSGMGAL